MTCCSGERSGTPSPFLRLIPTNGRSHGDCGLPFPTADFEEELMRYDYASYSTLAKAETALEDMFATGDVLPGEFPRIERRRGRYVITLAG
jgi:hypothetical protein